MVCFYKLWVLMHTPISGEIIEEFSKFSYERITGKGDFKSSEGCLEKFKKWFGPSLYNVLTTKHDTSFKTQIITQRIKKHKGRQYDQEIKGNKLERHCFFTCKCLGKRSRKKKSQVGWRKWHVHVWYSSFKVAPRKTVTSVAQNRKEIRSKKKKITVFFSLI